MRPYKPPRHPKESSSKKCRDQSGTDIKSGDALSRKESRPVRRARAAASSICESLPQECELRNTTFALIIANEDGRLRTFTSPAISHAKDALFTKRFCNDFARIAGLKRDVEDSGREGFEADPATGDAPSLPPGRRLQPVSSPTSQSRATRNPVLGQSTRFITSELDSRPGKRRKSLVQDPFEAEQAASDSEVEDITPCDMKSVRIGDEEAISSLYRTNLYLMQQLACRNIAKAWVKTTQPRKQSIYPYRGGPKTAPLWWPENVPHVEPDHLRTGPRMILLLAILRLRSVSIDTLKKSTDELQLDFVQQRMALLNEVYRVARQERRYMEGGLDKDATVCVASNPEALVPHIHFKKRRRGQDNLIKFEEEESEEEDDGQVLQDQVNSINDQPDENLPHQSVRDESPPLCDMVKPSVQRYRNASTGNAFPSPSPFPSPFLQNRSSMDTSSFAIHHQSPSPFLQNRSPMDTSSFAIHLQSPSAFSNQHFTDGTVLMPGSPDGATYLQRSHSYQGTPMSQVVGPGWQPASSQFTGAQSPYNTFIPNPPTLPSQPAGPMQYPIFPPGAGEVIFGLAQGQQAPEQRSLADMAHDMAANQFGQSSLMGPMTTGSIGNLHRATGDPVELNYVHHTGQTTDNGGPRRYEQGPSYTIIKEECMEE